MFLEYLENVMTFIPARYLASALQMFGMQIADRRVMPVFNIEFVINYFYFTI